MNQYVIIEKLKEAIGDKKVTAAIFYTFNFSAKFFENYILTTFLPHVNFSDHEIQNSILWRKYATELPPINVYCDFHAKGTEAPNLNYSIKTIDLPTIKGQKACFHPKVSFILLDDWTLVILTGSNNLSEGGWCTNKEIVSIRELKSGKDFPYDQKHQFWDFLKYTNQLVDHEYSPAENIIHSFFAQRNHTESRDFKFYHSFKNSFLVFLQKLLAANSEERFDCIEIISPYISPGMTILEDVKSLVNEENIFINVPYKATNEADITEENYIAYKEAGVKWSKFRESENEKGFRFNHIKVYRIKTSKKMFTVVGSINFTEAAWKGRKQNGNIETAEIIEEPVENWVPWLLEYNNEDIVFTQEQSDETKSDDRVDVPDFQFELNWQENTLKYRNSQNSSFRGKIVFLTRNIELKNGNQYLILDEKIIDELVNNPIIRVKQYHTQKEFFYYPIQIGFESKPLPRNLKLKDGELIELWNHISIKDQSKSEITDLIEKFILTRLDKEGNIIADSQEVKSTINMMASHISALIRLGNRIFEAPRLKRDYRRSKELLEYYLFMSNIDTLVGYRKLLKEMYEEKVIMPGVYWFLLNVLINDFYDYKKIKHFYDAINEPNIELRAKINLITKSIMEIMNKIRKELKNDGVNLELLKWIKSNL